MPILKDRTAIKKSDLKQVKLDDGIYKTANEREMRVEDLITELEIKDGFDPSCHAAQVLDPIERQLAADGIILSGQSKFEDFFRTPTSRLLSPAYVSREITAGMRLGRNVVTLDDLTATSQRIPSHAIEQIALDVDGTDDEMKRIAEGTDMPVATIATKEKTQKMRKVGRTIRASYESIRRSNLDTVSLLLRRIGFRMGRQMAQEGLRIMIDGDGNTGSAAKETTTTAFKYSDLVDLLYGQFDEGHEPSHICVSPAFYLKMLTDETNFKPFQSVNLLEQFVKNGQAASWFGLQWRTHKILPNNYAVAWEKETCLAYYEESASSIVETDKIISAQFNNVAVSLWFGFSKLFDQAANAKKQSP